MSDQVISTVVPSVLIDGEPNDGMRSRLVSYHVDRAINEPSRCVLRVIADGELPHTSEAEFAKELTVLAGPPDAGTVIFRGRIVAFGVSLAPDGPPVVVLRAEDRLHDLRMHTRARQFRNMHGLDVIRRIAQDHGLDVADHISRAPVVQQLWTLSGRSDLDVVRACARSLGADLWMADDDRTLVVCGYGVAPPLPEVDLEYGTGLSAFDGVADLTTQHSAVQVSGWDADGKSEIEETVDSAQSAAVLGGGLSGPELVLASRGERTLTLTDLVPENSASAASLSRSAYEAMARRFVTGTGTCAPGEPRLRAGSRVVLSGIGGWFEGAYRVVAVRHSFDLSVGYTTAFDVARASNGAAPSRRPPPRPPGRPEPTPKPGAPEPTPKPGAPGAATKPTPSRPATSEKPDRSLSTKRGPR